MALKTAFRIAAIPWPSIAQRGPNVPRNPLEIPPDIGPQASRPDTPE
jgi:hypothetical protein